MVDQLHSTTPKRFNNETQTLSIKENDLNINQHRKAHSSFFNSLFRKSSVDSGINKEPEFINYVKSNFNSELLIEKLFYNEVEQNKTLSSITITFSSTSSFDSMYTENKQIGMKNTRTAVYAVNIDKINLFIQYFLEQKMHEKLDNRSINTIDDLKKEIALVKPNSVFFNFESSLSFNKGRFFEGNIFDDSTYHLPHKSLVFQLCKYIIAKGYYMMFSDFSLKALINDWDIMVLGKNPLRIIGQVNAGIELLFDPQ